jgi:predicted glycogen debranching enzyme
MTTSSLNDQTEWLEADGLGGFASGTASGLRTRRYHALLLVATTPPAGRMVLVNGLDAWIEPSTPDDRTPIQEYLTRQRYRPGVVAPADGATLESFTAEPWPTWTYRLASGTRIEHELFVPAHNAFVALRWRAVDGPVPLVLKVRPFLSGRDSHATHHENRAFRFDAEVDGERVRWRPYQGVPGIVAMHNGRYRTDPQWYRGFLYSEELARGLEAEEDLGAPGIFTWDLSQGDAVLLLGAADALPEGDPAAAFTRLARREHTRRTRLGSPLERAGDAYLVRRGDGKTIIAGYPWFTDWGRDTFIALRGLCLPTGRLADARSILLEWAALVSDGMLPNRFVDQGGAPEYNTIDASLWYIIAVHDYLTAMARDRSVVPADDRRVLEEAVLAILAGHVRGTRYGIRATDDGLLAGGEPGLQLTWMDAKVGDWVVTPRVGKSVEIQALWLNALRVAERFTPEYRELYQRGAATFAERFWNAEGGYLHDVIDADHEPGKVDPSFRPNQIFAVGGLPFQLVDGPRARQVVDAVEQMLWTPVGLRTLAPGSPGYQPVYAGDMRARDGAYHQGTVWPWLLGPFVEAWVRVRGDTVDARREARRRFLEPLLAHLEQAGLGHISEIADAEPPHTPRGCPFQAWSMGEALRLQLEVLRVPSARVPARKVAAIIA